jgi:hypothetical protein
MHHKYSRQTRVSFMLGRMALRLYVERRSNREGSRIKTKLVLGAMGLILMSGMVLGGQKSDDAPLDEAAFRKAVRDGLQPDPKDRWIFYALGHESTAIPILVTEMKSRTKLTDPETNYFMRKAGDLAVYQGNRNAVDVAAELCQTDPKRFSWLVAAALNHANGWQREYELAYYAVEQYPFLRDYVVAWLQDSLKFSITNVKFAKEILKREKAGHQFWVDDPLLSRLPVEIRDHVLKAVERVRFEGH